MRIAKDMTGLVFGRLTVLSRAANHGKQPAWHCKCVCGKDAFVIGQSLRRGQTTSCGCYRREVYIRNMQRSQFGAKGSHRSVTLDEALAEVSRTWPQRLQAYARGEA